MARLGVMLPHTPLQHLLARGMGAAPLVMTSGNLSDEPIAHEDADARERLGGVAQVFLAHDRPIRLKCDDSVVEVVAGAPVPLRRARGFAPAPLSLPLPLATPTLAAGGHLKATFALGEGARAIVSHHLGDLDDYHAFRGYVAAVAHYERLFCAAPQRLVHDLHPDYASTQWALERAAREGAELVAVQHHHAHVASAMAEHGLVGRVVGVAFDGAGLGTDGAIWGGEFLVGDAAHMLRAAHFRYVAMPGGDRAAREPWRMAVAHLLDAGVDPREAAVARRAGAASLRTIERMVERGYNAPPTSSVGRLFDAVAAITGVCDEASFEGQAPMLLESLALGAPEDGLYPIAIEDTDPIRLDTRPLVREVLRDVLRGAGPALVARRLHAALAAVVVEVAARLCRAHGCTDVVLSGGVFANALLGDAVSSALSARGLVPRTHRLVPPNDGGLSLGQLAVVAARDAAKGGS
jgi:hydrogenase maturation protein HypF